MQVRLFLRRGLSVRYLLPSSVVDYIEQYALYQDESVSTATANADKGKDKDKAPEVVIRPVTPRKDGVVQTC